MSIVTCDVVESLGEASTTMLVEVDTLLPTTGIGKSVMVWIIASMLTAGGVGSDSAWIEPLNLIVEHATVHETLAPQADLSVLIVEHGSAKSSLLIRPANDVVEAGTGADLALFTRDAYLLDAATGGDSAILSSAFAGRVVERAVAHETLFGFNDYLVTEGAAGSSTVTTSAATRELVTEEGIGTDLAVIDIDMDDTLVAAGAGSDSVTMHVVSTLVAIEAARLKDRLLPKMFGLGWVMNSENFAMSRYSELPFSSMAVVQGRVFGLGEAGLYELAGQTDEDIPVDAAVVTGRLTLGTTSVKRIPDVFVTGSTTEAMALTVGVYGEKKGSYTYVMPKRAADSPRGHHIPLGKGLASVYWKFTIANKNGADFDIDTINADVAPSTNRRV